MKMDFTPEQLQKIREAKTAEELLELANAEGISMSLDVARAYFAGLNPPVGELTDQELDDVSGGGCASLNARFHVGDHVMEKGNSYCGSCYNTYRGAQYVQETCRSSYWVVKSVKSAFGGDILYEVQCPQCNMSTCLQEGRLQKVN